MRYYQIYGNLYKIAFGRNKYSVKNRKVYDSVYNEHYGALQMIENNTYGLYEKELDNKIKDERILHESIINMYYNSRYLLNDIEYYRNKTVFIEHNTIFDVGKLNYMLRNHDSKKDIYLYKTYSLAPEIIKYIKKKFDIFINSGLGLKYEMFLYCREYHMKEWLDSIVEKIKKIYKQKIIIGNNISWLPELKE